MKISSSTGDFSKVSEKNTDRILCYEGTGFRYLNLNLYSEAKPNKPLFMNDESWRQMFEDIGEASLKTNTRIILAHAPAEVMNYRENRDMYIRAVNRTIEGCALLGISDLVVHPAWSLEFDKECLFSENRLFYKLIMPAAEKFGINILAENNYYSNGLLNNGRDMLELLDVIGHPLLYVCWDTGHARLVKADQYESITLLGEKLRAVHIHDNEGYWDRHTSPFFGDINFDPIIQALIDIDYKGYFNLECEWILKPGGREQWVYHGKPVDRLGVPPKHIYQMAVRLLYEIGVYMLSAYDVYEE